MRRWVASLVYGPDGRLACAADSAAEAGRGSVLASRSESYMREFIGRVTRFVRDEDGGEVLEYALIAGLISVAAIAVIAAFGTKVLARWTSVNDGL